MKKILFNCSTNIQGGAAQNAANFIISSYEDHRSGLIDYHYFVSKPVKSILDNYKILPENLYLIESSPSKSFYSRRLIKSLEKKILPNLVYTMAGPSYINFSSTHLMGSSNPYVIFAKPKDISFGRTKYEFLIRYINTYYQKLYADKADFFIFQTKSSAKAFSKKFNIPDEKYFCVANSLGANRDDKDLGVANKGSMETLEILCPFENYPHKGFHLLPEISSVLTEKNIKHKFNVTINKDKKTESILNKYVNNNIRLIGKQPYHSMGETYLNSDLVFMPSILEIFSSVCLEAPFFRKPLILADRAFNRDIVGNYAQYCEPNSIHSCAEAILEAKKMINDLRYLNEARDFIVNNYGNYSSRYTSIKGIFLEILK